MKPGTTAALLMMAGLTPPELRTVPDLRLDLEPAREPARSSVDLERLAKAEAKRQRRARRRIRTA